VSFACLVAEVNDDDDGLAEDPHDLTSALPEDLQHIPYKFTKLSEAEMLKRSENFYQLLNARRTLRYFSKDHVPLEIIKNIIKAAGML